MRTAIHEITKLGQKLVTRLAGAAVVTLAFLLSVGGAPGATVTTDKADYQPGETVRIAGSGFGDGDVVTVQVVHVGDTNDNDTSTAHLPWLVTASTGFQVHLGRAELFSLLQERP